jgi:D-alanyl-D-alanine carboxypeptidase
MSNREPARTAARRARSTIVAALIVISAALLGDLGYQSLAASSSSATPPVRAKRPAVANLDPALSDALRRATAVAAGDGITVDVTSGWRSREDQEQLFREAVAKYGSADEATRWVALPGTSPHESGDAVDIGPAEATAWMSRHGAEYGLCQIYRNEPWHFELRPVDHGCPPMYADPTHDPRMHQ